MSDLDKVTTGPSDGSVRGQVPPVNCCCMLDDIDLEVLGDFKGRRLDQMVFDFVVDEIEKIGGLAVVEVTKGSLACVWHPPALEGLSSDDRLRLVYVAHLLQAGLLRDATKLIANTVYAGHGEGLSKELFVIHSMGFNARVALKGLETLVRAAPLSGPMLLTYGLVLMANGGLDQAVEIFERLLELDVSNVVALKYMTIVWTGKNPGKAVVYGEHLLKVFSALNLPPDVHSRAAYGYALLAAGAVKEAAVQFKLVCGSEKPKMTLREWMAWGFNVTNDRLAAEILSPSSH